MSFSISQSASKSGPGRQGPRIGIKRFSGKVQISMDCRDEYQAIEVYDRLVEAAQSGTVRLDLQIIQHPPTWSPNKR